MVRSQLSLLGKYADAFRALINTTVQSVPKTIKELLLLNSGDDWNFLCAAMDIIGDSSEAIDNVLRFGLSGPTKHDDIGEKYLRLYGLLSAVYVQEEAALTICRVMGVGDYKHRKAQVETLDIRQLRNKIASHGTAYRNSKTNITEAYVPLRYEIGDTEVTAVNNTSSRHEKTNITQAVTDHLYLIIDILDGAIEKSINTFYRGQNDKKKKPLEGLKDLRIEKSGGMVWVTPGGPKIIITFAGAPQAAQPRAGRSRAKPRRRNGTPPRGAD
ncbi:MAG: hypothetical protein ACLQJL_11430 [Roseiarcus sp.]